MSRYIDAEAFKRRILSYGIVHEGDRIQIPFYKHYFAKAYVAMLRWVCEEVDDTPAADVVEVVRCRDCVMWNGSFTLNGQKKCLNMTFCTDGDFYCGWGSKE